MTQSRATSAFEQALVEGGPESPDGDRPGAPLDPPTGRALFTWVAWGLAAWGLCALVPFPGGNVDAGLILVVSAALLFGVVRWTPWRRLPAWLQVLPVLAIYPLLAAVNHLDASDVSLVAILAIPAAWFAFLGTRRQVALASVATAVTYAAPMLLGLDSSTPAQWRSGIMLTVAVAVLGSVANRASSTARASLRRSRALAPSHEQLEAILQGATDHAIVATDLFGTITSFNVGAERMFGWTAAEIVGRAKAQDFHDQDELAARAAVLGTDDLGLALVHDVLEGRSSSAEWTVVTKDGRRLHVHLGLTGMRDDDGQLTGFIGIASDLTSQRRMADRYATLVESLPDLMVLVAGPDLVVTAASGRLFEGDGIPLDLMVGHHVREIADTCDPPVTSSFERACLGSHEVFECTGATGREYRGEIVPVMGPDGEVEEIICALRNVTAERATLRALERSEELHQTILSSLREGVLYFDRDGTVLWANEAATELWGVSEGYRLTSERAADMPLELPDGTALPMSESPLPTALRTGEPTVDQTVVVGRPDGSRSWLDVSAIPVLGPDGEVEGVVVSVSDETERREAEQAVALSRDHFSALIEHSHDMILVLDDQLGVVYASPSWEQQLGWDRIAERLTADPGSLVHREDLADLVRAYRDIAHEAGATTSVRYRARHFDGGWRTLEATITNLQHDPAVQGTVTNARDITPQVDAASKLTHQALHDALTGLPNRVLVQDRIQRALDRQRRDGGHVAVLFLDLDRFKTVNDSLGHTVGDAMLVEVGHRLDRSLRPGDTVGRLGGDEFIVIAEQLREPDDAMALARRLSDALNEPLELAGQHLMARASIGVVTTDGVDAPTPGDLLRDADAAMYKAKQAGRGRWEVFDDGLRRAALDRLVTEQELRTGLSRREFIPYFQPQYDLVTGRLLGAEALVRWLHPARGTLAPIAFLEVADSTGLLTAIGWQIFEQAFVEARRWRDDVPDFVISVNLSIGQLSEPDFAARLQVLLERIELAPDAVCLELTEYSLLELKGIAARELNRAKALGVTIAVDDFGTGYSNLQLLANVQVDVLKIDRSFVDPLDREDAERHQAVASAIISLGHALGLSVVAEGVERTEHVEVLLGLGCDEAQGYLFGRPVPPAEFVVGSCPMLARRGPHDRDAVAFPTVSEVEPITP